MGSEQAAVSLTCFYGPFRSISAVGSRCSARRFAEMVLGWMDDVALPAALFDAAELMEEAERLDGRAKVAGAEISAKRPTEVRWFVHSGNYEFMM